MSGYYDSFSELSDEDKLYHAKEMRDSAWYANLEWLEKAELAHKFKVGDQWSDEEKLKLQMQGREALVWNYIHSAIELTIGTLVQNPTRIFPYPTEKADDFLCEVLEDIVTYLDTNQLDADAEHLAMFENAIITGVGDIVIDVGPNPDNPEEIILYERALDAYEALVDPQSKKLNLQDARFSLYEKWVTAEDFKVRYPKHASKAEMEEIFTSGVHGLTGEIDKNSASQDSYSTQALFEYYDSQNKRILVTHFEYREAYKRYYYVDENNISREFEKEEKSVYKALPGTVVELYDTKVHWLHFIHDRILWEGESPVYKKDFSLCRLTAYTDKSKRMHSNYGIVKLMIDPQKECNRRWMHTLKLLSKQGVGVMAEIDAFHDLKQAEDSWADPDAITFMGKGGLNKVREKAVPQFPDAPMKLEELNKEAMKQISGINPDLMGIAQQRREPGINLRLRQKQGLTMLSKLFENYKRTLKEIYKRKLEIIVRFMPDTQIRKILGETEKYTFQQGYIIDQKRGLIAPIRKVRDLGYNIRMEDAPGGMNKMMSEFSIFMEMLEKGFPTNPHTVIDKLDLSPVEKTDWKAYIDGQSASKQKLQDAEVQFKQQELGIKAKLNNDKTTLESRKLDLIQAGKKLDTDIKYGEIEQKNTASKRDFAVRLAEMDADEKRDMVEIIKFVSQERLMREKTATPAIGAATSTGSSPVTEEKGV